MFLYPYQPQPYMATEDQMASWRNLCDEQDREVWLMFKIMMATLGVCLMMVIGAVVAHVLQ